MKKLLLNAAIKESAGELQVLERSLGKGMLRDRVRLIRLLKETPALTLAEAAEKVGGYKKSWAYQSFSLYQRQGVAALCDYKLKGRKSRLTPEQREQLSKQFVESGGVSSLKAAAALIKQTTGIAYCTSAVWVVLRGLGIKKKTGRPSHIRKDEARAEAFKKKTFPV